jgi:hypothetical protein
MNPDQFIYIDNERVFMSELNDRQKYLVSQISDLQAKLTQVQFSADQLNVALKFFSEELKQSRKKEELEPVVA